MILYKINYLISINAISTFQSIDIQKYFQPKHLFSTMRRQIFFKYLCIWKYVLCGRKKMINVSHANIARYMKSFSSCKSSTTTTHIFLLFCIYDIKWLIDVQKHVVCVSQCFPTNNVIVEFFLIKWNISIIINIQWYSIFFIKH